MLFTPWLATFRNRSSQRRRVNRRDTAATPLSKIELLETRTLLTGPEFVAIRPNVGILYDTMRDPVTEGIEVRADAPREVVIEFSPGESINVASAQTGIVISRAGSDGTFGDGNEVTITPGFVGVLDPTNQANQVTVRFSENLPDDLYRFEVIGSGATPLTNTAGQAFSSGTDFAFDVEFDLGAQIVSVVQEPITNDRSSLQIVDVADLADGDTFSFATANSFARAISDFGTGNVEVLFVAAARGTSGNSLVVNTTAQDLGMGVAPTVTVTGTQIDVTLNTNAANVSTAQDLVDEVNANTDASALLTASILSGNAAEDITGTPTAVTLAGGGGPVTFELEEALAGDGVASLNVQVDYTAATDTPADVATALANAINNSLDLPLHTATAVGDTVIVDVAGGAPAITVTTATSTATTLTNGVRGQRKNVIRVYFNEDDLAAEAAVTTDAGTDPSVVDVMVYQLHLTRETARNTDDVVYNPISVAYAPATNIAELTFENDLDQLVDPTTGMPVGSATFRLRVGNNEAIPSRPNTLNPGDAASDFVNALDLSDAFGEFDTGGVLVIQDGSHFEDGQQFVITDEAGMSAIFEFEDAGGGGIAGDEQISFNSTTPTSASAMATAIRNAINGAAGITVTAQLDPTDTTRVRLLGDQSVDLDNGVTGVSFASQGVLISGSIVNQSPFLLDLPGGDDEPAHRQIFEQSHLGLSRDTFNGITTIQYNFKPTFTGSGGTFPNLITEQQKDRGREIMELYAYYAGIQVEETDTSGFTIATIDMEVVESTALGLGTVGFPFPGGFALMNNSTIWDDTFGTSELFNSGQAIPWFLVAMHEIGHVLGTGHADEAAPGTVTGGVLAPNTLGGASELVFDNDTDPFFPGRQEIIHLQHIYRAESKDIDTYQFEVQAGTSGVFTAETIAERQLNDSRLDTLLTLWRENADGSREIISRNDDYYSNDSFVERELTEGTYYLTVTASGNDQFDPTIADSGFGGTTQGNYDLRLNFESTRGREIVDIDNEGDTSTPNDAQSTVLDGDLDGKPGGEFNFWFRTAPEIGNEAAGEPRTLFVDKPAAPAGDGSLATPFDNIPDALAAAAEGDIVRLLGNGGGDDDLMTIGDNTPYEIGVTSLGQTLDDGTTLEVPKDVTVVVDEGAIFKVFQTQITVGSSGAGATSDRSGSAFQVLGTPTNNVQFTSYNDPNTGEDVNPFIVAPAGADWGGIQFRNDIDAADGRFIYENEAIFLNYVNNATIQYGGGKNNGQTTAPVVSPIHMIQSRPTVSFNTITLSADHALSADPDSFRDDTFQTPQFQFSGVFTADYTRFGPDIDQNTISGNTFNDLFVRVETQAGGERKELTASARFDDIDITHVITDNLLLNGQPGGPLLDTTAPDPTLVIPGETTVTGGTLVAGNTYDYRMTFVDAFGFEAATSAAFGPPAALTGGNNAVTFGNLPSASGDFVARRLYRRTNGAGSYQLVRQLNGTSSTFTDDGSTAGGALTISGSRRRPRLDARLRLDPGTVLKVEGSRIQAEFGAQFLAEGEDGREIIITSLQDDSYGFGGSFDTNGNGTSSTAARGDWGGLYFGHTGEASIDQAVIQFGGGTTELEGNFRDFNVIEIHQADVRISNTIIQENADGNGGPGPVERFDLGRNEPATIFVRGAQPILLSNTIQDNSAVAINIDVNSLGFRYIDDPGRSTGISDIDDAFGNNRGPLVRRNLLEDNGVNGMQIRGGTLQTQSVWDDTDIVHYLEDTIYIADMVHYGGLRLESSPNESLVVKLNGGTAGFEATGRPLEIEDRIGGMLHIVGAPLFPVVLTSIHDDNIGAGFDPRGFPQNDTNNNGGATTPGAGDWDSVLINQFAHDRNVQIVAEQELNQDVAPGVNAIPQTAQLLGGLGQGEKDTDENLRLGFEVNGYLNAPGDYDVYSFTADAGSEIWLDIDRTTQDLDTVVELIDLAGNILAQSDNSHFETTQSGNFPLINSATVPDVNIQSKSPNDFLVLNRFDYYTTNPRDAGMRLVLPGAEGTTNTYYVRVRSSNISFAADDTSGAAQAARANLQDVSLIGDGLTFGVYQLQVRLREGDEFAGSSVNFADIRYPTTGIQVIGHPIHTTVAGEGAESEGNNDQGSATDVGNILNSDRATLGLAGALSSSGDVDFFEFEVSFSSVQGPGGDSIGLTFDVDYADVLARPDTVISVFDVAGNLVYIGRNSNIGDDQPGPNEVTSLDDLSRGSAGVLDPFIGSIDLAEGTYFATVSRSSNVPQALQQFTQADAANKLLRLEPIDQVDRIVEDRINGDAIDVPPINAPQQTVLFDTTNAIVPFHLGDVALFASTGLNTIRIFDPFTGAVDATLSSNVGVEIEDVAMRADGELFTYSDPAVGNDDAHDDYIQIDTGDGSVQNSSTTNIDTFFDSNPDPVAITVTQADTGLSIPALTFRGVGNNDGYFVGYRAGTPFLFNFNVTTGIPVNGARAGNARVAGSRTNFQEVGPVGADIQGMAFVGGTLYGVDDDGVLYTISTGTGAATFVGNLGQNEIQQIETINDPTMGTFTLEFGGDVTNALDFDATANEIQNELQMLSSLVTDEVQIVGSSDLISGGAPIAGTYQLTIPGFGTTGILNFDANLATVEGELDALITAGGFAATDLDVTGTLVTGFTLSFVNSLLDTDIGQTTIINNLTFPSALANDVEQTISEGGIVGVNVTSRFGGDLSQSPMLVEFRNQFDNINVATLIDVETGFDAGTSVLITTFQNAGNVTGTTGLAVGPDSVEGGIYANTLFVSNSNTLYAFDTTGEGQRILVDGATSVPFGAGGVTGIDFGTLDRNLWHVTTRRSNDASRGNTAAGGGGNSLYFGNESGGSTAGNKNNRAAPTLFDYNFPGGAHGTLESEPFSLVGYAAEDRPVLYFNYHIATANAATDNDTSPSDTLRVWIAGPDGDYDLIASNNSNGDGGAEQILFDDTNTADNTAEWRQARIQLDDYAGLSDLKLRVDFSSAGRIRTGSANLVGDELRAVAATSINDADTFTIDGNVFEFERGYTIEAPTGLRVNDGDQFSLDGVDYEFTLAGVTGNVDVVFTANMTARELATVIEAAITGQGITVFRPGTGTRLNIPEVMIATDDAALPTTFLQGQFDQQTIGSEVILINSEMTANDIAVEVRQAIANVFAETDISVIKAYDNVVRVIGHNVGNQGPLGLSQLEADQGDVTRRGQDNAFEGVYLDDFIVGLTERGEEALQAAANSTFAPNANPQAITGGASAGEYQLEIRRSHEHLLLNPADGIDSNQRNLQGVTITTLSGIDYSDGDQFVISDGVRTLTFEFDDNSVNNGVAAGIVEVGFLSTFTADQVAESIRDAINATSTQNILGIRGLSGDGPDSGTTSTSSLVHLVGNAVSDTFGNTTFAVTPGLALSFEVHDRRGDANHPREQGQVIVQGNQITDAEQYGIDVQAGVRNPGIIDNGGAIPHPGSPIRFEEPNAEDLVPGVVVINNVVANSGTGGIRFGGTADTTQNAPTPFGRIVNNTVYGGGSGIGIRVENNASPTLLNNLLADLTTGISIDGTSSTTVRTANYFQDNTTNVAGGGGGLGTFSILGTNGAPLFVDVANDNYYLAAGATPIDTSLDAIGDRQAMFDFRDELGISRSPILAPDLDAFGQKRVDEPNQSSPSGLGLKDRGAVERADFDGPSAHLVFRGDVDTASFPGSPLITTDELGAETVFGIGDTRVIVSNPLFFNEFVIELQDEGIGVDDNTVLGMPMQVQIDLTDSVGTTTLVEGADYFFNYNSNTNRVFLTALTTFIVDRRYTITLTRDDTGIKDRANNRLQANQVDGMGAGVTRFDILLVDDVNDTPTITNPGAQLMNERNPDFLNTLVFSTANGNQLVVADEDAFLGTEEVDVTLAVSSGALTVATTAGLTFTAGDSTPGALNTTMTFTGVIGDVNTALDGLVYTPVDHFNVVRDGLVTFMVTVNDRGNFSVDIPADPKELVDMLDITIDETNSRPLNTLPATGTTNEDTVLEFSTGNGNLISIGDPNDGDPDPSVVQVTLTAGNGTLTLEPPAAGLDFGFVADTDGSPAGDGMGDATMTFRGTITAINAALDGLDYLPNEDFNGADTLTVTLNDLGNTGVGGSLTDVDVINITVDPVNDDPINHLNLVPIDATTPVQTLVEETSLIFSSANLNQLSVVDVDATEAPGDLLQVTLEVDGPVNEIQTVAITGVPTGGMFDLSFNDGATTETATLAFDADAAAIELALRNLANINGAHVNVSGTGTIDQGGAFDIEFTGVFAATDVLELTGTGAALTGGTTPTVVIGTTTDGTATRNTAATLTLGTIAGLDFMFAMDADGAGEGDGMDDRRMTFRGTFAAVNAALASVTYTPGMDYNGPDALIITSNDLGNTGAGGSLSDTDTVIIDVDPANDPPVNTVPGAQTVDEDTQLVFSVGNSNLISISEGVDGDPDPAVVQVTLSVLNGTLTLSQMNGLDFSFPMDGDGTGSGDGDADASMTFRGTITDINAALSGMFYLGNLHYNGPDTLTITTNDLGNTGVGGSMTDIDPVAINVTAINDAPVNQFNGTAIPAAPPNTQVMGIEEQDYEFSVANMSQLSVVDVDLDEGTDMAQVTLTATDGVISLATIANLDFGFAMDANGVGAGDGMDDLTMTFRGLLADINAALVTVTFTPDMDFTTATTGRLATLTITTNDLGNFPTPVLTDTDVIELDILEANDPPVNTVPGAQTVAEDGDLFFSMNTMPTANEISIDDPIDAVPGSTVFQVTVSVLNGTLTLSQLTGLDFAFAMDSDGTPAGDGTDDVTMTFRGSIDNINAALEGLLYEPNPDYNGSDTLTIITNDLGNTGAGGSLTDTDTVPINVTAVNDAPINNLNGTVIVGTPQLTALEDTDFVFSSGNTNQLSITDVDAADGSNTAQVTLTATNGVLSLGSVTGLDFTFAMDADGTGAGTGSNDVTMTFRGSFADINAALATVTFTPDADFNTPLSGNFGTATIETKDLGNAGAGGTESDTDVIELDFAEANDAPSVTLPAAQMVDEDLILTLSGGSAISVDDPTDGDPDPAVVQVTISAGSGLVSLSGTNNLDFAFPADADGSPAGDGISDATMTFRGTLTDINLALDGLMYQGNLNFNGTDSITVTINDLGNSGVGSSLTNTQALVVTVDPVNDAPENMVPGDQNATEDQNFVFSAAGGNQILITDLDDPTEAGMSRVTLSVDFGTLTIPDITGLSFTTGTGANDTSMTFTGQLGAINTAIDGLVYSPPMGFNNADATLTVFTEDLGNIGSGPDLTDTDTVRITVDSDNDAPINTVPGDQTTLEQTPLVFSAANSNQISVTDIDAGSDPVRVTLTAVDGELTLAGGPLFNSLVFNNGDGTSDTTMTFTGAIGDINTALNGLSFLTTLDSEGVGSVTILTDDLGNNGVVFDPQSDSDTVNITIEPVNDAPVVSGPVSLIVDEDSSLTISAANMNGVTIDDVDIGSGKFLVTVSLDNGTLTLRRTTGLTFTGAGGDGQSTMTFTGSRTAVNSALDAAIYTPDAGYTGADTLTIIANDQGSFGAGGPQSDTLDIPITVRGVNDAPVLTLADTIVSLNEDESLSFSTSNMNQISVADVDVLDGDGRVESTLSANNGTLTLSTLNNITVTAGVDGSGSLTFNGPIGDVNVALSGLVYQPNLDFSGTDTIDVSVSDLGNAGFMASPLTDTGSIAVSVDAVNDAPVNAVPGAQNTPEDNDLSFSSSNAIPNAITISDVDAGSSPVDVTLAVTNGGLTLGGSAGLDFSQTGGDSDGSDGSLRFRGSIASIITALDGLTYSPTLNFFGSSTLTITTSDLGNDGSGGAQTDVDTVSITVDPLNDQPVAVADSYTLQQGATLTVNDTTGLDGDVNNDSVLLNDSDPDMDSLSAVLEVAGDPLFHNGVFTLNPNGTFTYQHDGSTNFTDSFTYHATDGSLDSTTVTVTFSINAAPTVTGATFSLDENSLNGTVVGTIAASDANMDSLLFSFTGGNTNSAFAIDNNGQITVSNSTALDFESNATFPLIVEVDDSNGGTSSAAVTINLNDLSEAVVINPSDFTNDGLTIVRLNSKVRIVNTVSGADVIPAHELAKISSLTVTGRDGVDDTVTVDFSNGSPIPATGISYDGGTGGVDTLDLIGGSVTDVSHTFTSASSGSVSIDGSLLSYTGLEPITDLLAAQTRSFAFGATADIVTVADSGTSNDGRVTISSVATSETVDFNVPAISIEVLLGGANDTLNVNSLDGNFIGTFIVGGEDGNDTIDVSGLGTATSIFGGAGNDIVTGGGGADLIFGDAGNDVINGGDGNDIAFGGAGADILTGGDGTNQLHGQGTSFDIVRETVSGTVVLTDSSAQTASLTWATGSNILRKDEFIELTGTAGAETIDLSGFDLHPRGITVLAGEGADIIVGSPLADSLEGQGGNDNISGGAGADFIDLGDGNDIGRGDDGADLILGGAGDDDINGGNQTDIIDAGLADVLDIVNGGGSSADRLLVELSGIVTLNGKIIPRNGTGNILIQRLEKLEITGSAGDDRFDFSSYFGAVTLNAGAGDDTYFGTEQGDVVRGEEGNDVVEGNGGNDYFLGGAGDDAARGGEGDDIFVGDLGKDSLLGGVGNDFLLGSGGQDLILGEEGDDVVRGQGTSDQVSAGGNGVAASPGDILLIDAVDQVFGEDLFFDFDALL